MLHRENIEKLAKLDAPERILSTQIAIGVPRICQRVSRVRWIPIADLNVKRTLRHFVGLQCSG